MPYYGSYRIDTKALNISENNRFLNFSISTDSPCEFTVWLLNSDVKPVMDNMNY